jgi:ABC-2 type transport system ATP-binding protein
VLVHLTPERREVVSAHRCSRVAADAVLPPRSCGETGGAYVVIARHSSFQESDEMTPSTAVYATGLVKTFDGFRAVDGIDLEVRQGEIFGVLGPNGAGKTTTLKMLATLLPIDAGRASVFGVDVASEPHRIRQLLGVTGQYASVDEDLTATENLWLFGRLQGLRSGEARAIAKRLLEQFALEEAADKPIAQFSGGMRRRLDLAASLITRPPLIFLDEPTTGLDPRTRGQMWDTIRGLVADGCTVLLTTQYLDEADQLADRISVIDRGRKVAEGTPDELKSSVGNSTLQLQLAAGGDEELALQVVRRVVGAEPVSAPRSGQINVPLDTADATSDVLIGLRQAGVSIASVSVSKPTLDEVFLTITGHDTTRPQPPEDVDIHDEMLLEVS